MSQNLQHFVKFQKFQLENLVDFEKCCRTHSHLQKSIAIQPRASPPKNCKLLKKFPSYLGVRPNEPRPSAPPPASSRASLRCRRRGGAASRSAAASEPLPFLERRRDPYLKIKVKIEHLQTVTLKLNIFPSKIKYSFNKKFSNFDEKLKTFLQNFANFGFRAVQRVLNLVDLEKC